MKSNFSTAVKNYVAKAVASSANQYGNIVRLSVVGAFAMGAIFTFSNAPVSPGHATVSDVAVVLLAQELGTGATLGSGTGGQVLAAVMEDSSLWTASGDLIFGDIANPTCTIHNDGTYTGCNFTGTGFTLTQGDNRYIRKAGGTMTGALTIDVNGGVISTIGLNVIQTLSGAIIHAEKTLASSGTLSVDGLAWLNSNVMVSGTLSASGTVFLESGQQIVLNDVSYLFPYGDGAASGRVLKTSGAGQLSWATDTDTTYSAGKGMTLSSGFFVLNDVLTGSTLRVTGDTSGSGVLSIEGAASLQNTLFVGDALRAKTLSGGTLTVDSLGAAPAGSVPCVKTGGLIGYREVSASGTLLPTCN